MHFVLSKGSKGSPGGRPRSDHPMWQTQDWLRPYLLGPPSFQPQQWRTVRNVLIPAPLQAPAKFASPFWPQGTLRSSSSACQLSCRLEMQAANTLGAALTHGASELLEKAPASCPRKDSSKGHCLQGRPADTSSFVLCILSGLSAHSLPSLPAITSQINYLHLSLCFRL